MKHTALVFNSEDPEIGINLPTTLVELDERATEMQNNYHECLRALEVDE